MKTRKNSRSGQALTEYIIIVVVVALAAISIVAVFSDTIRAKFGGAVASLGGDTSAAGAALGTGSSEYLRSLDQDGER